MRRLAWSVALAVLASAAVVGGVAWAFWSRAQVDTVGELRFEQELRIPPLLEPERDGDGRRVFDLDLREGRAELLPGKSAETWGVNGPHLGPTLRATRGDTVAMRVRNSLPEPTTLHWHGMHLPAEADGGPHQPIDPGATWEPGWTIDQPAATLWYHPHLMGETEEHVYRGIAGMFILDDPAADALALPDDYGADDIPLIVQDKRFDDDGSLSDSQGPISPVGQLGDTVLVNGTYAPHLDVGSTRVRLRLLNASKARVYEFGLSDDRAFDLIATDGGLLARPERLDRITLSPGERAEIVVGFEPGERLVLRSFAPDLGAGFFEEHFAGGDDRLDILELRAADELAESPAVPDELVERPALPEPGKERRFELDASNDINDRAMDMDRIDFEVPVGSTEVWEVENTGGVPHSFHVHDTRFEVIDVDGEAPPPELRGLKDTVFVPPGDTVRLLVQFTDYTDPDAPYMFHCHLLQHEDRGMMGQFVVVSRE